MRYTLLFLLLLCQFVWCGEAPPTTPVLSPAVQKALLTYDQKLNTEKQKYLAAAMKVQQELRKTLDAEVKLMTQKGDLDGALAVKAKLVELDKQMVTEDPLFGLLPPGSHEQFTGATDSKKEKIIGVWQVTMKSGNVYTFTFAKDNVTASWKGGEKGTWTIVKDQLTITWSDGTNVIDLPTNIGTELQGVDINQLPMTLRKAK